MKSTSLFTSFAAFSSSVGLLQAGEKTPVAQPLTSTVEVQDSLGLSLGLGYDTKYVFRGVDLGDHAIWFDLAYEAELTQRISLTTGAWYVRSFNSSFDTELDLYAGISWAVTDKISLSTGYTWYGYFGKADVIHEPYLGLSTSCYGISTDFTAYYDDGGYFFELEKSYDIAVTDKFTLTPAVTLTYAEDYYGISSWNNITPSLTASYQLQDNFSISSYLAWNAPLQDLKDSGEENTLYAGVSFTLEF